MGLEDSVTSPPSIPCDVSVIVVNYEAGDLLVKSVQSARGNVGDIQTETIVVDNGSCDGSAASIRTMFPDVKIINNANTGFAAANNIGINNSKGDYILLLNPDAEILNNTAIIYFTSAMPIRISPETGRR